MATVAPSSALEDDQRLQEGLAVLRGWGLCPLEQNVSARRWGHLAGTDQERLSDLTQEAPLLACVRGGWGSARLLERPIAWQPGWLLGFSVWLLALFSTTHVPCAISILCDARGSSRYWTS